MLLQRTLLGNTGLAVSPICFGTAALGDMPDTFGYSVDAERARETVRAIFDSEVNFLDTSRIYGMGRSEERIGEVIRERGGLPDGFVISTKLDRNVETGVFDGAQARRSIEESLKALNLDKVQLLHIHDPEHAASLEQIRGPKGAIAELIKLKEEGLCDAIGLAAGVVETMMPLLADFPFDALITHNRFTLVNRNAAEMMDFAAERGIAVINAAPYATGVLAKGTAAGARYVYQEATEEQLDPIRRIEAICARYEIPTGAAALQFSLRDPRVASTVCGVTKPERVQQTLQWATLTIPEQAWAELMALPFEARDPEATRDYKPT